MQRVTAAECAPLRSVCRSSGDARVSNVQGMRFGLPGIRSVYGVRMRLDYCLLTGIYSQIIAVSALQVFICGCRNFLSTPRSSSRTGLP